MFALVSGRVLILSVDKFVCIPMPISFQTYVNYFWKCNLDVSVQTGIANMLMSSEQEPLHEQLTLYTRLLFFLLICNRKITQSCLVGVQNTFQIICRNPCTQNKIFPKAGHWFLFNRPHLVLGTASPTSLLPNCQHFPSEKCDILPSSFQAFLFSLLVFAFIPLYCTHFTKSL